MASQNAPDSAKKVMNPAPVANRRTGLPARHRVPLLLTPLLLALFLTVPSGGNAAEPDQSEPLASYRLVDTWQRAPWEREPGRYGRTLDLSSSTEGTQYVLDGRRRALHVTDAAGQASHFIDLPAEVPGLRASQWHPLRLDVGADGKLYLLLRGPYVDRGVYRYRVDRLESDGSLDFSFEISRRTPSMYRDIAARPDGRIYVSRSGNSPFFEFPDPEPEPPGLPPPGVDIYRADGVLLETLLTSCMPDRLDFGPDGRLYVANRCPVPLDSPGPPGATPTPEPSLGGGRVLQQDEMPAAEGILIFGADHGYLDFVPFINPEDVTAGPAGAFVARNVEIFPLGQAEPLYSGPTGALSGAYFDDIVFNLDAPAGGGLGASMNHCYFQGLLRFEDPSIIPSEPILSGALDNPELEGPPNPGRIAAGDELAVMMDRYGTQGARPDHSYYVHPYLAERRTVQRWPLAGADRAADPTPRAPFAPTSQLGLCGDAARDVAMDGRTVFSLDPDRVQARPDDRLPGWTWWPALLAGPEERPALAALSADADRLAVLDLGRRRLSLLSADGGLLSDWSYDVDDPGALPGDLALAGDRIYLAEPGRGRLVLHADGGRRLAAWPTHDGPRAVAAGPEGDAFVLGAGGWGMRYQPDGRLLALWPMPDRSLDARDIAVDGAGRVYVSWARRQPYSGPRGRAMPQFELPEAGIWVFEPGPPAAPEPPARGACLAAPDKQARPARLPLGGQVEVELRVEGACPPARSPAQLMWVVDDSRSMSFDDALSRARDFLAQSLLDLDPEGIEQGLVGFEEGARLIQPLGTAPGALRSSILALEPEGDTRMAAGIDLATAELTGPRGDPSARRVMVLVTDGLAKDEPLQAAERARAAGIELQVLIFATYEYSEDVRRAMAELAGADARVIVDPMPLDLEPLVRNLSGLVPEPGLFEAIRVLDRIPANMRYLAGSADPPARYDADAHSLTWELGAVTAAAGLRLTYDLQPLECGLWPTNIEATADYLDALGQPGRLIFPIPEVEVICDPVRIYLPLVDKARCHRRSGAIDVILVTDASSSMAEPGAPDGRSKLDLARQAGLDFAALLQPGDRAGLVSFDGQARVLAPLSADRERLSAGLSALQSGLGTRIDLGLAAALELLGASPRSSATPVVILLSDGLQNEAEAPREAVLRQAERLRGAGSRIYAIGLGSQIDEPLLRSLAGRPEAYLESPSAEDLSAVYRDISERLACDRP